MNPRHGSALLGLLLLGAAPAHAAAGGSPLWGTIGLAAPAEMPGDVGPFAGVSLSIDQAMRAAQRDGRVVEIGFAHKNGAGWYQALVLTDDGLRYLRIDPASGALGDGDHPPVARADLTAAGQRDLDGLRAAKVPLAQAVGSAEQASGGKAISAGVEQLGGVPQYYVQTVSHGKLGAWTVDPQTGRVSPG